MAGMTGKELMRLRRQAGISRQALALQAGMHEDSIGRKERGEASITIPEADFFRRVLARAS